MGNQQLQKELRGALERQEFCLHYQPKVDLSSGRIAGVEALIRWNHPQKGIISPLEFIPLAEETGLILPIGEWVLRTACEQNQKWQYAGLPAMIIAVNVSARQLNEPNFAESVERILEETGLSPQLLELEITENMVMDVHHIIPILKELKSVGVQISLDDFGTGYSSLSYLSNFPIDVIKIDQSFVRNWTIDTKDGTIVKAIIAMAHQLKVEVIAEGIESKEHLIFLQQNLCNKGQGYFFSKSLPPKEFEKKFDDMQGIIHREGIPQEVSREKWLEKELENARQELRDTVRQQQGMIFKYVERNGKFIHTLCDGELVYRIGLTPEQIVGRELMDFLPMPDAQRKLEYYRRAWEGEDNLTYEAECNGVWYLASLRSIRKGGQVVEVIASCVDISERVKKEQEVALLSERFIEQEAKYRLIADNADDFITMLDTHGNVEYVSPSCERLLGISIDGRLGKPGFQGIHLDDLSLAKQGFDHVIVSKSSETLECRYVNKDGIPIWVEVTVAPILLPDGQVERVLAVARNISKRKKQENKLRESEQRYRDISERLAEREAQYRLLAENAQDLIGVVNMEGIVLYASPSHELVLGFPPSEYEGNSAFDFVHPDDLAYVKRQFDDMVTLESSFDFEWRCKKADGSWVYIETRGTPIFDENRQVVKCVYGSRDISERKKAEELLVRTEKLSVVGQMAAGVAHEFRNPLTSIKGFAQLLQQGNEKPLYIEIILSEVRRLEAIVGEFLTLAKQQAPKMQEVDAVAVLKQVVLLFSTQSILHNIEIIEEHDSEVPRIYCDKNQIKQVFINILQNAVDAMPNGGIIKTQVLCHDSEFIKFRFIDQGCGITSERIKSIGEPFYSSKEKGTGLGLMVSNKIVHEHGGSIYIQSMVDVGTTVDVILPIKR